jgi:hypothetical protein
VCIQVNICRQRSFPSVEIGDSTYHTNTTTAAAAAATTITTTTTTTIDTTTNTTSITSLSA